MKKYSLYTLLFVSLILIGIILVFSIYVSNSYRRNDLINTEIDAKKRFAGAVSDTISSSSWVFRVAVYPGMEEAFIFRMAQFPDLLFIRIVDSNGNIRRSNITEEVGQIIEDSDILTAIRDQTTIVKDAAYKEEKIKLIIYPSPGDKTIWVGFSLQNVETIIKKSIVQNAVISFSVLFLVLLIFYFVFRSITNPLKKINMACQKVGEGNLDVKIDVKSKTEIGELATTFNEMIKELKKSQSALEEAKTTLEIKVQSRTQELKELTKEQDETIKEKTKQLQERVVELEKFQKLTIGRELKMIEQKKEIEKLKEKKEK